MAPRRHRKRNVAHDPGPDSLTSRAKRARGHYRQENNDSEREDIQIKKLCARFNRLTIADTETSCVKIRLSTFFKRTADIQTLQQQQFIKDEIERSVCSLRQIQIEACHLANLHILRCIESRDDPDESKRLNLPQLDNTFFSRCISGVGLNETTPSKCIDPNLRATIDIYRNARQQQVGHQQPVIVNWGCSKEAMARTMRVNARNMIVCHFYRRLLRYVKLRYGLPTRGIAFHLIREAFQLWGPRRKIALELRFWLEQEPTSGNIERDLGHFIIKLYDMLIYMEGRADNGIKEESDRVFSLLPSSTSFVPSHIEINSSVLLQIWARMRQCFPKETRDELDPFKKFLIQTKRGENMRLPSNPEFQLIRDAVWREHFNISHFESGSWRFTHTITTNGYEVSVVRKRVVVGSESPFLSSREFDPKIARDFTATKVIGLDPGMKELCTTATVRTLEEDRFYPRSLYRFRKRKRVAATRTDKWKKKQKARRARRRRRRHRKRNMTGPVTKREHVRQLKGEHLHQHDLLNWYAIQQISTREYRHLAGFNKVRYWEEGVKRRYPAYSNLVHRVPSFKTAYSSRYWTRLKFVWTHINWLIDFCSRQAFRKQRFYAYVSKSKALSHITERIVPVASPTVFVGYGNWSKCEGIKGHPSGPVKGLSKELARRATVRRVDEFRTSKCCYHCHNTLEGTVFPNIENGKPHGTTFSRYALRCKNSVCNSYWDRDVNASLNIMQLTTALLGRRPRPDYLQRKSSRA